jgi:hypothetical protein
MEFSRIEHNLDWLHSLSPYTIVGTAVNTLLVYKMDLREIGFGNVDWIHLAQDRDRWRALVNTVMNLRVP